MTESELPGLNGDRIIANLGRQLGDAHVRIAQLEDVIATLVERDAAPRAVTTVLYVALAWGLLAVLASFAVAALIRAGKGPHG